MEPVVAPDPGTSLATLPRSPGDGARPEPGPATEPDPDASGWSGPSPFQDLWKIL